jgi:hypothetical protein
MSYEDDGVRPDESSYTQDSYRREVALWQRTIDQENGMPDDEALPIHDAFVLDTDEMEPDEFLPVSEFLVRVDGVDAVYVALRMGDEAMYVKFDPMLMQDFLGTVRIKMVAAALKDQS